MKSRILVIEDERSISELICMNLEVTGYEAIPFYDGAAAAEFLKEKGRESGDLALVDVMLPEIDGFSLMKHMSRCRLPVIYLTAKGDVASKVKGLKLGAEDYLVKPFEILELLVRIEKVLERTGKGQRMLAFQGLLVDVQRHQVWENGREVMLKPMEFRLLVTFLKNRNLVLGRDRLLDLVWGSDYYGETRTVDVHVAKLRRKLQTCEAIRTIPKSGYLFEDDSL